MLFLRTKSRNSLLFIFACSFGIPLLLATIHVLFTKSIFYTVIGLTSLLLGSLICLRNKNIAKARVRLALVNSSEVISTNTKRVETAVETTVYRTINTHGNPYNENIGRDYIGRDSIRTKAEKTDCTEINTNGGHYNENIAGNIIGRDSVIKNVKNITIGNKEVEVNPYDIVETLNELRVILAQSIAQSSDALEAISEFAKELTEELRKHPEVRLCFNVDENITEQELLQKIFIGLLTKTDKQASEIDPGHLIIKPDRVQKINIPNGSEFIEHFKSCGNDEYDVVYKSYTVHLFQEQSKWWLYKIRRSNSSILKRRHEKRSSNIYFAIGRAINEIEKEKKNNWEKKSE